MHRDVDLDILMRILGKFCNCQIRLWSELYVGILPGEVAKRTELKLSLNIAIRVDGIDTTRRTAKAANTFGAGRTAL